MNIPSGFIHWIFNYLTNRSQFVKLSSNCHSDLLHSNTGAPQGTVLAPFLFTLYTCDARSSEDSCPLVKFADDTALIGLIKGDDHAKFLTQLNSFVNYCVDNFLILNVSKTKEMVINFKNNATPLPPVQIKDSVADHIHTYKYLGIVINDTLTWGDHIDIVIKRLNSRLYCLRKLANFDVRPEILSMFYCSIISGVFRYCLVCWGGNVSHTEKKRIDSIIRNAGHVIGESQPSLDSIYDELLTSKLKFLMDDQSHPLFYFTEDNQMKSGRLRLPTLKSNRYRDSFLPCAIKCFNDNFTR